MKNLWNDAEAAAFHNDDLGMRVYTSRLLGRESDLVLHGGGNTSVKSRMTDPFGEEVDLLYVKGSGWDLATIEKPGFAPVRMDALLKMAALPQLSDSDMVRYQRAAMTDPYAPNPSVEAILHAVIPFKFVDHTHADAVVTVTNTPGGRERIDAIYGKRVLVVPYVMPGFVLAKAIYDMTRSLDWNAIEGMILMNHGVFTFSDDARESYGRMISLVSEAEEYLKKHAGVPQPAARRAAPDPLRLAQIRQEVSQARGGAVVVSHDTSPQALAFSELTGLDKFSQRGPVTPDHIIRTKRVPLLIPEDAGTGVAAFSEAYRAYFQRNHQDGQTCLDPAPRWAVWPGCGVLSFGRSVGEAGIIRDITQHTVKCIRQAEALGGWQALPESDLFDMEYWELEQAKLGKGNKSLPLQGRIALVTGAAGGIGRACAEELLAQGAVVAALDREDLPFAPGKVLNIRCDVTDAGALAEAVKQTVLQFGGLDMVISNAGTFPPSRALAELDGPTWAHSLDVNLTSHRNLLSAAIPYLERGMAPSVVLVASKNVPAPGPGAAAYSVAKAGLTQLGRVAALELGGKGIRVNMVHPNAVFDTGIWTEDVLQARAAHYGMSVEAYKRNNVLQREVRSADVARLAVALCGDLLPCTTGAQIPVDGGNDRVI